MLEQEASSRREISEKLTKELEEVLKSRMDRAKIEIGNATDENLRKSKAEIGKDISQSQDKIRDEIKDSLLRVVEVLGVFLAVAGRRGYRSRRNRGRRIRWTGRGYLRFRLFHNRVAVLRSSLDGNSPARRGTQGGATSQHGAPHEDPLEAAEEGGPVKRPVDMPPAMLESGREGFATASGS